MPPAPEQPTEREARPVKRAPKAKSAPRRKGPRKSS
jgi:hypothetical protein